MSLENILTQVATVAGSIQGIKKSHNLTPESIAELPNVICFPSAGDVDRAPSQRITKHKIKMQFRVSRANLPSAEKEARPYLAKVLDKFDQNVKLNGSCENSAITHYEYGALDFAGSPYLGWSFDILVTEQESVEFDA
ncbi:MAG: hypothetical protein SVY53_05060 [Chloroflexota bacterium]|nr:hypothetical protein [Chloroflexota bacterium]